MTYGFDSDYLFGFGGSSLIKSSGIRAVAFGKVGCFYKNPAKITSVPS